MANQDDPRDEIQAPEDKDEVLAPPRADAAPEVALVPARAVGEGMALPGRGVFSLPIWRRMDPEQKKRRLFQLWAGKRRKSTMRVYAEALDRFANYNQTGAGVLKDDPPEVKAQKLAASRDLTISNLLEDHGGSNLLVQDWLSYMREEEGLSPNTIRMRAYAIKSLVKMAFLGKIVTWTLEIDPPKAVVYKDTRGASEATRKLIWKYYKKQLATELPADEQMICLRDFAMITLLQATGLRRFEISALNISDLHFDTMEVSVKGKGKDLPENLPIEDPRAVVAMKAWLEARLHGQPAPADAPVFIALDRACHGNRLSVSGVAYVVSMLAKTLEVKDLHVHGFRHTYISLMTLKVSDPAAIMKAARHKDFKTTLMYIDNAKDRARGATKVVSDMMQEEIERWEKEEMEAETKDEPK